VARAAALSALKRLLRSGQAAEEKTDRVEYKELCIDVPRHQVTVKGKDVDLTATEFKLLLLMIESPGITQERGDLLKRVWGYNDLIQTRTLDTHIKRLREKLGNHGNSIETVRGVGYRFQEA
jgi:two-component system phosphate regulon response regulator PhoB